MNNFELSREQKDAVQSLSENKDFLDTIRGLSTLESFDDINFMWDAMGTSLEEDNLTRILEDKSTEEALEFFATQRRVLEMLDNRLTELDSQYNIERDENGEYLEEHTVQEENPETGEITEINLMALDNDITQFHEDLDRYESQYREQQTIEQTGANLEELAAETDAELAAEVAEADTQEEAAEAIVRRAESLRDEPEESAERKNDWKQFFNNVIEMFLSLVPAWLRNFFTKDESDDEQVSDQASRSLDDLDPSLLERQEVTREQLESINPPLNEREVASIELMLQNNGPHPFQVLELLETQSLRNSHATRETLFKFIAQICEAAMIHNGPNPPIEIILPVMLGTIKMESNFRESSINGSSNASGLFQQMPQYWLGRLERYEDVLRQQGLINQPLTEEYAQSLILDSRIQTIVTMGDFNRHLANLNSDWQTYDPAKIARDLYLQHNSGQGHAWAIELLDQPDMQNQIETLYSQRNGNRTTDGRIFNSWFYDRMLRDDPSWNRVQNWNEEFRTALYGTRSSRFNGMQAATAATTASASVEREPIASSETLIVGASHSEGIGNANENALVTGFRDRSSDYFEEHLPELIAANNSSNIVLMATANDIWQDENPSYSTIAARYERMIQLCRQAGKTPYLSTMISMIPDASIQGNEVVTEARARRVNDLNEAIVTVGQRMGVHVIRLDRGIQSRSLHPDSDTYRRMGNTIFREVASNSAA